MIFKQFQTISNTKLITALFWRSDIDGSKSHRETLGYLSKRSAILSLLFILSLLPWGAIAQVSVCQLPQGATCAQYEPGTYKVITTSKTFTQMIADNELLPAATSGLTPQFLVVCETITDDVFGLYTFAEGSEIIFLNNTSGLIVNSGANLRCRETFLHGCQKLWNSVRVNSGGWLSLTQGCRIEDAFQAIQVQPNSTLIVQNCIFDGNYSCIYAGGGIGNPNQFTITATISGNVFSGQKALIENYYIPNSSCFYSKPRFGMEVFNINHMTVGVNGLGTSNVFRDYSYSSSCALVGSGMPVGIFAQNSNLTVVNSRFSNIAKGQSGRGISFQVSPGSTSTLDFTGLGTAGLATFDGVEDGIIGLGNITVRTSHFNNLNKAINLTGSSGPYTVNVLANSFYDIEDNTVHIENISPINRLVIKDNSFLDNSTYSDGTFFPRSGVYLFSFASGYQNSWFYNNTFLNESKKNTIPFEFNYRGITIRNLGGSLVEYNRFNDNFSSTARSYEGVNVFNASTWFWHNYFTGAGNWDIHPSTAILTDESSECRLNCNFADNTKHGWDFKGMNCDGASLEKNVLNAHKIGLRLRSDAVIGNQNNKYNRWPVMIPNTVEAQHESNVVPLVQLSLFSIHTPDLNTEYWPNPRLQGGVPDVGVWFVQGAPATVECLASDPGGNGGGSQAMSAEITEADLRVMDETYQAVKGYDAGLWEAQLRLFGRLNRHPELRPVYSTEAAWYDAQENTTVGALGNIYQGILSLSRYSTQEQNDLETAANGQQTATQAIAGKDAEIAQQLNNTAVLEQLISERQQLALTLSESITDYQSVMANLVAGKLTTAQQLLLQLNNVATVSMYETDFKTVCRIMLETYISQSPLSETNRIVLQSIAQQCRYEGGLAVVQARACLNSETDWATFDNCPDATAERNQKSMAMQSMKLYPNPASDASLLDMGRLVTNGHATLRDLNGRVVQVWDLTEQKQIHLRWGAELLSGLYLLEVVTDQSAPQTLKMTIERN